MSYSHYNQLYNLIIIMNPLKVRTIISTVGEFSQVVVDAESFKSISGLRPTLPYTTARNQQGKGVRVFDFGGTKLYARYDKEARRTIFVMQKADAEKHLTTLESERAGEAAIGFSF